tara:strand:- start:34 stop:276 length:243 start_codon:yes stop_codon:yes gene_type:complete
MNTKLEKHLKKVKKENKIILNKLVEKELNKIFKEDYYGSKEQIFNEKVIMNNTIIKDNNLEMKYNESIEEYYLKIYDFTK